MHISPPLDSCISSLPQTCGLGHHCPCRGCPKDNCPSSVDCVLASELIQSTNTCQCTSNGGSSDLRCRELVNNCAVDEICACASLPTTDGIGQTCESRGEVPCWKIPSGVAHGDPHFIGFDGSKFDFHGINQHICIIYSEKNGDILCAKSRSTNELYHGINKTYFEEFGLQLSDSKDKIYFFLVGNGNSEIAASVNEKVTKKEVLLQNAKLLYDKKTREKYMS